MSGYKPTLYYSLMVGNLESCSNCGYMCGAYTSNADAKVDLVLRDSSTGKIVICPNCNPEKKEKRP